MHLTGNTGIDALLWTAHNVQNIPLDLPRPIQELVASGRRFVLITGHRRESFGKGFESICQALRRLASMHQDVVFLYPVHLNPNVRQIVFDNLSGYSNILLADPLPYRQFVAVMRAAYCLLTDSGGVQEEAPSLKKPVLVMRDVTERPEGVEAGCSRLVGTDCEEIVQSVSAVLGDANGIYQRMVTSKNPYGDGRAAERIAAILVDFFSAKDEESCA
ncbi:MAG: UDP-N-acetylglucosamine 2-epimerase (non-hydrolyzing) [Desulfovibrio sp.]|uniref:non-hydrolyzing UDP-N-acetylglucosamine 2-epimerase n=1 Tax=Desulfovibrio sp. TaxID=885 RepID=UPI0039E6576B